MPWVFTKRLEKTSRNTISSSKLAQQTATTEDELNAIENFAAYPNPLSEEGLWLQFPVMEQAESLRQPFDLSGSVIIEKTFAVGTEGSRLLWKIDQSDWFRGLYLLIIQGEDTPTQTIKLMK